jgi:ribulose-5-phosphate 4-epimerase/fuculose-1-phosphate aldolase
MTAASFADAKRAIVAAGRRLDGKGWAPATAGNYSMRPDDGDFAITLVARLTAFELASHGVPHMVIADNAGGHLMMRGQVDAVNRRHLSRHRQ